MQAMRNVNYETAMRDELAARSASSSAPSPATPEASQLTDDEADPVLDLADLVTRARTAVERDFKGNPVFAHALEMPTRLAKQLVQLARGGLALGMDRDEAMAVVAAWPPTPCPRCGCASSPTSPTTRTPHRRRGEAAPAPPQDRRPRLQELHLLELLTVDAIDSAGDPLDLQTGRGRRQGRPRKVGQKCQ